LFHNNKDPSWAYAYEAFEFHGLGCNNAHGSLLPLTLVNKKENGGDIKMEI